MNKLFYYFLVFPAILQTILIPTLFAQSITPTPISKLTWAQLTKLPLDELQDMGNHGNSDAQFQLAITFCATHSLVYNFNEGVSWCRKAIDNGNSGAAEYMANLFEMGAFGQKDMANAMKYFWLASSMGNQRVIYKLAKECREGSPWVSQNLPMALSLYQRLVDQNDRFALVPLADMYALGEGTNKDLVKAKTLLDLFLKENRPEDEEQEQSQKVLCELDGCLVRPAITGDISFDHPRFPPLFIYQRVYQNVGESIFKPYFLEPDGSLLEIKNLPEESEPPPPSSRHKKRLLPTLASGVNPEDTSGSDVNAPEEMISPSGKWKIILSRPDEWGKLTFTLLDTTTNTPQTINIPDGGWGFSGIDWNPKKDLFYFQVMQGVSSDRHWDFFQFSPDTKIFTAFASGQGIDVSPDGNWIAWIDNSWGDYGDRQMHVYDINANRDYILTRGHADHRFFKWGDIKSDENITRSIHGVIQKGFRYAGFGELPVMASQIPNFYVRPEKKIDSVKTYNTLITQHPWNNVTCDRLKKVPFPDQDDWISKQEYNSLLNRELLSMDKKYGIVFSSPKGLDPFILQVHDSSKGVTLNYSIPNYFGGRAWRPLGWHPYLNRFYLSILEGIAPNQHEGLFEFDPTHAIFLFVGDGNGVYAASPNSEWIIWTDSSKHKNIHTYNVIHQMNCSGIGGVGSFEGWEKNPTNGIYSLQTDSLIKSAKDHFRQHQLDLAISDYLKAIQTDPYNDDAYGLLGYAYYRNKQFSQAQDALQLSIRLNPNNFMSYYNLALVLWAKGQKNNTFDQLKYLFTNDRKYISLVSDDTQFHEIIHDPEYGEMVKKISP